MPGGGVAPVELKGVHGTSQVDRIEAPATFKAYLMCAFAATGGLFFGYDSGYISGVQGMRFVIEKYTGINPDTLDGGTSNAAFALPSWEKSLITSILSAGTFFGAILAGDLADWFGRRTTILAGCAIFCVGVVMQGMC